jgi:hypothetical protein
LSFGEERVVVGVEIDNGGEMTEGIAIGRRVAR